MEHQADRDCKAYDRHNKQDCVNIGLRLGHHNWAARKLFAHLRSSFLIKQPGGDFVARHRIQTSVAR